MRHAVDQKAAVARERVRVRLRRDDGPLVAAVRRAHHEAVAVAIGDAAAVRRPRRIVEPVVVPRRRERGDAALGVDQPERRGACLWIAPGRHDAPPVRRDVEVRERIRGADRADPVAAPIHPGELDVGARRAAKHEDTVFRRAGGEVSGAPVLRDRRRDR